MPSEDHFRFIRNLGIVMIVIAILAWIGVSYVGS